MVKSAQGIQITAGLEVELESVRRNRHASNVAGVSTFIAVRTLRPFAFCKERTRLNVSISLLNASKRASKEKDLITPRL